MTAWFYTRKYWKRNTDIFPKGIKNFFIYKKGYSSNFRKYYGVNSKEALLRKIYKDYLNIAIDRVVSEGSAVVIGEHGVTIGIKTKPYNKSPYNDVYEEITADGVMPYIYLNTGELIKENRTFTITPNKKRKYKLFRFIGSGSKFTKLKKGYFK